jgi:hypothetical protein
VGSARSAVRRRRFLDEDRAAVAPLGRPAVLATLVHVNIHYPTLLTNTKMYGVILALDRLISHSP